MNARRDLVTHRLRACSANRVGAFMMILRVLDQGWSEEKALEEARRIGLRSPVLEQFAQNDLSVKNRGAGRNL